ncbi:MAG: response regulator [Bacteroidales bacterium]|nr:response regulator [Bacteroidales bacterium]
MRSTLKEILEYEGYRMDEAPDGMTAGTGIEREVRCYLCDIKMPRMDGIEVSISFFDERHPCGDDFRPWQH